MSRWIKKGAEFINALADWWKGSSDPNPANEKMDTVAEEASGADSIAVRPESKISVKTEEPLNQQEIERRREIVRRFFNDFWKSSDDKPATFAERLNRETRMCRFPASGSSWESLARGGVTMDNSRRAESS